MRIFIFILIAFIPFITQCSKSKDNCQEFSFDERQCGTDTFLESGTNALTKTEAAEAFLKSQGIDVISSEYDPEYYDNVCEACDVCPTGLRFFFQVKTIDDAKIQVLNLLNTELKDCP